MLAKYENRVKRPHPSASTSDLSMSPSGKKVPGDYINVGNGEASAPMQNHGYDFSDEAIKIRSFGD